MRPLELFERHGDMVFRRCRQLLGSDEAASDAVQDVFLKVVQGHDGFRSRSSATTWLYSIATLHCLQLRRNQKSRDATLAQLVQEEAVHPTSDDRLTLQSILDLEDATVRAMVLLRLVDRMEVQEIAQAIGCSRKTVTRQLQRFLESARNELKREGAAE